jgi:hypothetical protein
VLLLLLLLLCHHQALLRGLLPKQTHLLEQV